MPGQTTWADIPPEVVEQILQYCDRRSLLTLSQLNHQLNSLALSRCFAPQIVDGLIQLPSRFSEENLLGLWRNNPPMDVLQTAFWLPQTIQHIDYCLPLCHNKTTQYINDLHILTAFIEQMPKLTSLRINRSKPRGASYFTDYECQGICNELLATAISKGCRILEIKEGGLVFNDLFWFRKRSLSTSISRLGARLSRLGTQLFCNLGRAFAPQTDVQPFLQEVQIDGGSFENWSIFPIILSQHAASITRLSLTNLRTHISADIATIFSHIHFPALESFTFSTYRERISSSILLKFISRHQTLIDLDIDGRPPKKLKQLRWNPPAFPNLRHLGMSPKTLAWLIDFRRCPKLHSVSLKGIDRDSWEFGWGTGEMYGAITSTLNDLHISPSMMWPLKVEVTIPLENLDQLSACYTIKGGETQRRYSRVKELIIKDTNWYKPYLHYHPNGAQIDVLVNWLSTFPSLESIEIASSTPMLEEEFVRMVVARCPKLRSFGYPYTDRFHGKLGRKWRMWDVQSGTIEDHTIWRPAPS